MTKTTVIQQSVKNLVSLFLLSSTALLLQGCSGFHSETAGVETSSLSSTSSNPATTPVATATPAPTATATPTATPLPAATPTPAPTATPAPPVATPNPTPVPTAAPSATPPASGQAYGTACTSKSCNYSGASQNATVTLSCASGVITLSSATYGLNGGYESCLAYQAATCNGQASCSIVFSDSLCGVDPSPGLWKSGWNTIFCSAAAPTPTPAPVASGGKIAAPKPFKIMPLGDSITYGYLTTNSNGYRAPLYQSLETAGYSINFVGSVVAGNFAQPNNEGHPGYRIDQISTLVDGSMAAYSPDLVLLMLGSNDILQAYGMADAASRLDSLITQIQKDRPTVRILVASVPPIVAVNAYGNCGATSCNDVVKFYNSAVVNLVAARMAKGQAIGFVDIYSSLTASEYEPDGVHPNDAGGVSMAGFWLKAIEAVYQP